MATGERPTSSTCSRWLCPKGRSFRASPETATPLGAIILEKLVRAGQGHEDLVPVGADRKRTGVRGAMNRAVEDNLSTADRIVRASSLSNSVSGTPLSRLERISPRSMLAIVIGAGSSCSI